jgi:hypothetical protein
LAVQISVKTELVNVNAEIANVPVKLDYVDSGTGTSLNLPPGQYKLVVNVNTKSGVSKNDEKAFTIGGGSGEFNG